jgi:hypothetical protein
MGTRRSRHNRGRKPLYKEKRTGFIDTADDDVLRFTPADAAALIMARPPRYYDALWLDHNRDWADADLRDVAAVCQAGGDINKAADIFGRPPKSIAHRARDLGLTLPPEWRRLVSTYISTPPRLILAFPYIAKARPEHSDLLRVNNMVPRGFSEWVRADIAQNIMLALYEGTVTIEDVEKNKDKMRWFIKKFYQEQSPHQEVSMTPLEDDGRSYDEIASAMAAESYHNEANDRRCAFDAVANYHAPSQIEDVFEREVRAAQFRLHRNHAHVSRGEARAMLESGEFEWGEIDGVRMGPHTRQPTHAMVRAGERWGLRLSRADIRNIGITCQRQKPARLQFDAAEIHFVVYRGIRMPIVYSREQRYVQTILPPGSVDEDGNQIPRHDSRDEIRGHTLAG